MPNTPPLTMMMNVMLFWKAKLNLKKNPIYILDELSNGFVKSHAHHLTCFLCLFHKKRIEKKNEFEFYGLEILVTPFAIAIFI